MKNKTKNIILSFFRTISLIGRLYFVLIVIVTTLHYLTQYKQQSASNIIIVSICGLLWLFRPLIYAVPFMEEEDEIVRDEQ